MYVSLIGPGRGSAPLFMSPVTYASSFAESTPGLPIVNITRERTVANESCQAAMELPGGEEAANLKVAVQYIEAFANLAKTNNTIILPANLTDIAGFVASAMTVLDKTGKGVAAVT